MTTQTKPRWTERRLATRPSKLYSYYVTGCGEFPVDMLRHDDCWPETGEDASVMFLGRHSDPADFTKLRSVYMNSHREPTLARWSSFGWSVGTEKITRGPRVA